MNFYQILGLSPCTSHDRIKPAYHQKLKVTHPDKGGQANEFIQLQKAFQTLNDPDKRRVYDLLLLWNYIQSNNATRDYWTILQLLFNLFTRFRSLGV